MPTRNRTKLTTKEEHEFKRWYGLWSKQLKLNPDPDAPGHKYDYRGAFKAGVQPDAKTRHWDSKYKDSDHPNRFVKDKKGNLIDSISGKKVKVK